MPAPLLIRREHVNVRAYLIPAGEVVDSVTVSASTWPDNNPLTNWTAYEIPEVERANPTAETEEEVFRIPRDTGGYIIDREETVIARRWSLFTRRASTYTKRLEHGLAVFPTASTATAPGAASDPFLFGVLLLEMQNKNGAMTERVQMWGKLRLVSPGEIGPATRLIEMSFEMLNSGLNSYVILPNPA
jgi:hypothetical protein